MVPTVLRLVVLLAALAVAGGGCGPTRRTFDSQFPDIWGHDDGGAETGDVEAGDHGAEADGGETDVPPPPQEVEDNDPFHGGTAEPLLTPATIEGTIGYPAGDHPDWDVFAVDGTAGTVLRINAYSIGGTALTLAVRIVRLDAGGAIVWERDETAVARGSLYRDAFLPEDGTYLIVLSDRVNFLPSPGSWTGGSDFAYELTVSAFAPSMVPAGDLPWTWSGTLPATGLIETIAATPAAGTRVEAIAASSNGDAFDPWLTVFDTTTRHVLAEDGDAAGGSDALVRLTASGDSLLFVIDHLADAPGGSATLSLALRAFDPAAEAEPNDTAASADRLDLGAPVAGVIAAPAGSGSSAVEDRDLFVFDAVAGQTYSLAARRDGGAASTLDPAVAALRLLDTAGRLVPENPLAFADDTPTRGSIDAVLLVTARRTGPLYAEVRDARNVAAERNGTAPTAGGTTAGYVLTVSAITPATPTDLGDLATPVERDGAAATGGAPDAFRFDTAAGMPALFALADLSSAGTTFSPLAYVSAAGGTPVLLALEPPRGGAIEVGTFVEGAGGPLYVGDALGSGGAGFLYRLDARALTAAAATEGVAANDTRATAEVLTWDVGQDGVVVSGTLDATGRTGPDAIDVYRATVGPDARVVAFTGPAGADAPDTIIAIRDGSGTLLVTDDDMAGSETLWSSAEAVAGADGVVYVEVSLWGAGAGAYRLFVGAP